MHDGLPSQKELERELNEYLAKKYGHRVRIISTSFPHPKSKEKEKYPGKGILSKIEFDLKPEELIAYLDQYIIKQDQAKAILATKICTHFNRVRYWLSQRHQGWKYTNYIKNNILMMGPTGVGKTYMVKLIAQRLGVPFVKGDATKFSETGYVGGDVEDLVRELVHQADGDVELAQFGIIYIDEIDKIASSGNVIGPDVSRTGVQRCLLKPMEETEVDLRTPYDPISQLEALEKYRRTGRREKKTINTRHILFVMSGAFNGIEETIKRRLNRQGIGFGAKIDSKKDQDYLKYVKAEDLIKYGFESEFIGRLPVLVVFDNLEVDDLYKILKNPNSSIINAKKQDFHAYGIDIVFEDEALRLIAEKAAAEGTGARGLVSVVERCILPFERALPSTNINKFVVTKEVVQDPVGELKRLLECHTEDLYKRRYWEAIAAEKEYLRRVIDNKSKGLAKQYGLRLTEERISLIVDFYHKFYFDIDYAFKQLAKYIKEIREFERDFFEETGLECRFCDEAIDVLLTHAIKEDSDIISICQRFAKDLELGLKLVKDRTGQDIFEITREALLSPEDYIRGLIKSAYQGV